MTLVSSNDIITIKIDKFFFKNHKKINKQKRLFKIKIWAAQMEANSDYEMKKRYFANVHFVKKCLKDNFIPIPHLIFI